MKIRHLAVLLLFLAVGGCASPAASPNRTFDAGSGTPAAPTASAAGPSGSATAVPPSASPEVADSWTVVMTDAMRYEPGAMAVRSGVPVTFVVSNGGVIEHEFFIGTEAQQLEHAAEMASGGHHGHGNALSLAPGATDSLTVSFAAAEALLVGCHVPGHYEAGMVATLTVVE
jgi:uncharacterized cupredoxin-like copper-binding protein